MGCPLFVLWGCDLIEFFPQPFLVLMDFPELSDPPRLNYNYVVLQLSKQHQHSAKAA
jgi:hypothetical protein